LPRNQLKLLLLPLIRMPEEGARNIAKCNKFALYLALLLASFARPLSVPL
jgi:hypothetical protein